MEIRDGNQYDRDIRIALPPEVGMILQMLKDRGYEAYAVGGCVRDSLLGRSPGDWDITTSALPQEIKRIFRRTVDTGIEHGTVTVLVGEKSFEVTTYRIDGGYRDGRHPEGVRFTDALSEDLLRRDFTINAMAYNEDRGLVDLYGGREDLKRRVIRCVGVPEDRFQEDALRILRAVRFAAQLDFDIDSATRGAIASHAPRLKLVSKERIMTELTKLICSAHIERVEDLFQLGMVPFIAKHFHKINIAQMMSLKSAALSAGLPEAPDELPQAERAVDLRVSADTHYRYIRFAFLTEGMEAAAVGQMLADLKADNQTRRQAVKLAQWILEPLPAGSFELKRIMSGFDPALFADLLRIKAVSSGTLLGRRYLAREDLEAVFDICARIAAAGEPVYLQDLAVNGTDLKARGVKEGPELGRLLKEMQDLVWREPGQNEKEKLLARFLPGQQDCPA